MKTAKLPATLHIRQVFLLLCAFTRHHFFYLGCPFSVISIRSPQPQIHKHSWQTPSHPNQSRVPFFRNLPWPQVLCSFFGIITEFFFPHTSVKARIPVYWCSFHVHLFLYSIVTVCRQTAVVFYLSLFLSSHCLSQLSIEQMFVVWKNPHKIPKTAHKANNTGFHPQTMKRKVYRILKSRSPGRIHNTRALSPDLLN